MIRMYAWLFFFFLVIASFHANAGFGPSAEELAADIEGIQAQIFVVEEEVGKYQGGLILNFLTSRREILKNTKAMLEQKQASLLKLISLDYTINGKPQPTITSRQLEVLLSDISNLEQRIIEGEKEAAKYSGGLILMVMLSTLETQKMTLATLRMRYLTARHGIPIFGVEAQSVKQGSEQPAGAIVTDEDAL